MHALPRSLAFFCSLGLCIATMWTLAACDAAAPTSPGAESGTDLFAHDAQWASARAGQWRWFPDSGMRCRDSSATGFGLRRELSSDRLLIMLQTGGACYDEESCAANDKRFGRSAFNAFVQNKGSQGIYADSADNPFQGWNVIMVPYCTGDIHGGDTTSVTVPGVSGSQQFVGLRNLDAMLQRIAYAASNASTVVLSGGGFAVAVAYGTVAERLAPAPVHFLADAGPAPPEDSVLTPELQLRWRDLWNLEAATPSGCLECFQANGDGFEHVLPYYAATYPDRYFGLVAYMDDPKNRAVFATDNPNCVMSADSTCRVPVEDYETSLYSIRSSLDAYPNAGTYYIEGTGHISFTLPDRFYQTVVDSVALTQWVGDVVNGTVSNVGP